MYAIEAEVAMGILWLVWAVLRVRSAEPRLVPQGVGGILLHYISGSYIILSCVLHTCSPCLQLSNL